VWVLSPAVQRACAGVRSLALRFDRACLNPPRPPPPQPAELPRQARAGQGGGGHAGTGGGAGSGADGSGGGGWGGAAERAAVEAREAGALAEAGAVWGAALERLSLSMAGPAGGAAGRGGGGGGEEGPMPLEAVHGASAAHLPDVRGWAPLPLLLQLLLGASSAAAAAAAAGARGCSAGSASGTASGPASAFPRLRELELDSGVGLHDESGVGAGREKGWKAGEMVGEGGKSSCCACFGTWGAAQVLRLHGRAHGLAATHAPAVPVVPAPGEIE
jgi:hypothetical protein